MTQSAGKHRRGTKASQGQEEHLDSVAEEEEVAPELPGRMVQASIRAPLCLPSAASVVGKKRVAWNPWHFVLMMLGLLQLTWKCPS